ncbi:MAG: hypothetical protein ACD_75C01505G0002 [uncultured bacterium]|nr:MAG: hypothetical protein ACD_75C01505G0002 [uncultured bacterium]
MFTHEVVFPVPPLWFVKAMHSVLGVIHASSSWVHIRETFIRKAYNHIFFKSRRRRDICVRNESITYRFFAKSLLLQVIQEACLEFLSLPCRTGIVNLKVLPLPNSLSTHILPPCSARSFCASTRPSPVPRYFLTLAGSS